MATPNKKGLYIGNERLWWNGCDMDDLENNII